MEEYLEYKGAADAGFKVLVHAQEDPPYIKELGFGLAPGMHHFVALRKMEVSIFYVGRIESICFYKK